MDIRDLARQGHSLRAIARITGLSRNTVRKVLRGEHDLDRKDAPRASKLDPFKDYLRRPPRRAPALGRPAPGGDPADGLRRLGHHPPPLPRLARRAGPAARRRLTVRFETPPGRQAQADWAHAGTAPRRRRAAPRPVYAFTFVLSYSRMLYVRFTTSMNLATLVDCHQRAFDYLGGWPQAILYDNMKQVRLGPGRWNEAFLDFANHYGFTPKTHRPTGRGPRARSSGPSTTSRTTSCSAAPSPTWTTSTPRRWPGWPRRPTSASTPRPAGGPWTCSRRGADAGVQRPGLPLPRPGAAHRQLRGDGPLPRQPLLGPAGLRRQAGGGRRRRRPDRHPRRRGDHRRAPRGGRSPGSASPPASTSPSCGGSPTSRSPGRPQPAGPWPPRRRSSGST